MANRASEVSDFLRDLSHPMKEGVITLRDAILASDSEITEHIKWNAPSFCYRGDDRVTFRLRPADRFQVVFHRGAKVRHDSGEFTFDDPDGLLQWASADRATVTLGNMDEVRTRLTPHRSGARAVRIKLRATGAPGRSSNPSPPTARDSTIHDTSPMPPVRASTHR
jgi:hypothetical protein